MMSEEEEEDGGRQLWKTNNAAQFNTAELGMLYHKVKLIIYL